MSKEMKFTLTDTEYKVISKIVRQANDSVDATNKILGFKAIPYITIEEYVARAMKENPIFKRGNIENVEQLNQAPSIKTKIISKPSIFNKLLNPNYDGYKKLSDKYKASLIAATLGIQRRFIRKYPETNISDITKLDFLNFYNSEYSNNNSTKNAALKRISKEFHKQ